MNECHYEFVKAWEDYPSQDNEGYVPDRGDFKAGWYMAWRYRGERVEELAADRDLLDDANTDINHIVAKLKELLDEKQKTIEEQDERLEELETHRYLRGWNKMGVTHASYDFVVKQRDKLKEALEFYADDSKWRDAFGDNEDYCFCNQVDISHDWFEAGIHCGGNVARTTLKECFKGEEV